MLIKGDSLDLILAETTKPDLIVTDPPYAFGGSGGEHALSATVAVVLREAAVMIAVISVMLIGLFDPQVDNDKVFAILGPAFQTIVGCFVGILGSRVLTSSPP